MNDRRTVMVGTESLAFFVLATVGARADTAEEYEEIFVASTLVLAAEELYPRKERCRRLDFGGERVAPEPGRLAVGRAGDQAGDERPRWVLVEQGDDGAPRVAHLELSYVSGASAWVDRALARLAVSGQQETGE